MVVQQNQLCLGNFTPDCIILNNDLSDGIPRQLIGLTQPIFPTTELGWSSRLKSQHFAYYRQIVTEFGQHIGLDPWLISPLFDDCQDVDFSLSGEQDCLFDKASELIEKNKFEI